MPKQAQNRPVAGRRLTAAQTRKHCQRGADYPDDISLLEQQQAHRPLLTSAQLTWYTRLDIIVLWDGAPAELVAEEYHTTAKVIDEIRMCRRYFADSIDYLAIRAENSGGQSSVIDKGDLIEKKEN